MMTSAQVVETLVTTADNSPSQDYTHPDDQTTLLHILDIISSLYIVFSLCARVGWCDVCTDFTNVIKVDVDLIIKVDVDLNRGAFFLRMFCKF